MGSSRALVPESPLYAQTLDSREWLMGCTRMVWLCDRFWVEIRQGRSRPGDPSPVFAQATESSKIACSMQGNQMPAKLFPYFQSTLCDQWKT
jgi:hypothetical protein